MNDTPGYARYKLHDVEKEKKGNAFLSPQQDTAKTPVLKHLFNCMSCSGIHAIYNCVSPSSNSNSQPSLTVLDINCSKNGVQHQT
jgi:hypothetical protein